MTQSPLTIGAVARHFGVPAWKVRRLFERNILPAASRCGLYRVIGADELPTIEAALRSAGYLPSNPHKIAASAGGGIRS